MVSFQHYFVPVLEICTPPHPPPPPLPGYGLDNDYMVNIFTVLSSTNFAFVQSFCLKKTPVERRNACIALNMNIQIQLDWNNVLFRWENTEFVFIDLGKCCLLVLTRVRTGWSGSTLLQSNVFNCLHEPAWPDVVSNTILTNVSFRFHHCKKTKQRMQNLC